LRQTQASLLMFSDDDDLLVEDYYLRAINRIQSSPDDCTFGFSASYHLERDGSWTEVPSKSPAGVLGNEAPLKYRQAGLRKGCWITRTAFDAEQMGSATLALRSDVKTPFGTTFIF
jgi:hypothetical protein